MSTETVENPKKTESNERGHSDDVVSMRELLECGVHFGHQTKRWNPKMKPYIFTARNGIHVIDLQQSIQLIKAAHDFIRDIVAAGGSCLFVGTKKQAQDSIRDEANRCEMPYVNHRWLGGTLTNNQTIQKSIRKLKDHERLQADGTLDKMSNKEFSKRTKAYTRLTYYLSGIKDMGALPSVLFVVDTKKETLAIKEANRLGIPIVGLVDTNADPTEVSHPIPANDDAIRAIKLLCSIVANAVEAGKKVRDAAKETKQATEDQKEDPKLKQKVIKETKIQATPEAKEDKPKKAAAPKKAAPKKDVAETAAKEKAPAKKKPAAKKETAAKETEGEK